MVKTTPVKPMNYVHEKGKNTMDLKKDLSSRYLFFKIMKGKKRANEKEYIRNPSKP